MSRKSQLAAPKRRTGGHELALLISSILATSQAARAQQAPQPAVLEDIVVTAQKREENLQNVPVSIQAFDNRKLEELNATDFNSIAKYLPSLTFQSLGPGQAQLYVRGVTNAGDGLRVGSLPLVGMYLDDLPVTTIGNSVDLHLYDIARVEALSGPQGTLFGASSMAGTLRIFTNKPDPGKFAAGYDIEINNVAHGASGGKIEGFVNLPVNDRMAIRLVGYTEHDGGYIDNVRGPMVDYPSSGIPRDNSALLQKDFNDVETTGGRAALKLDLDDNWTVTPNIIYQHQVAHGTFFDEPSVGDLNIAQYFPQRNDDVWHQIGLTVEGKISNLDVNYTGGYFSRKIYNIADYSDYSFFYDTLNGSGAYIKDNAGNLINPAQETVSRDTFTKQSHELRVASPKESRLRFVAGLFYQRQTNNTRNEYRIKDLADDLSISGQPGVYYLNSQYRTDRDRAVFGEVAFDLARQLTLTLGARVFDYDNSVVGFYGYRSPDSYGESSCPSPLLVLGPGRPCDNIHSTASGGRYTKKVNLTYKFDNDKLVYFTYSDGFRPGGVNRIPTLPPYTPDTLTNYEIGWKTSWFERTLRFNGALFVEKWNDAQFGIYGPNAITEIVNAGRAKIKGIESDFEWLAAKHLTLSGSMTLLDAKLLTNSCNSPDPTFACTLPASDGTPNSVLAPAGTRLPVSPKFKGNLTARYQMDLGRVPAHAQISAVHQSNVIPQLTVADAQALGTQPPYTTVDFNFGIAPAGWNAELYIDNAFDKRGESYRSSGCVPEKCTTLQILHIQPRVIGIRFGQKF